MKKTNKKSLILFVSVITIAFEILWGCVPKGVRVDLNSLPEDIDVMIYVDNGYYNFKGGTDGLIEADDIFEGVILKRENAQIESNKYSVVHNKKTLTKQKVEILLSAGDYIKIEMNKGDKNEQLIPHPKATMGNLTITGCKSESEIYVKDKKGAYIKPFAPYKVEGEEDVIHESIQTGKYDLHIKHSSYETIQKTIVISEDKPYQLELTDTNWELKTKKIKISWLPKKAKVTIGSNIYSYEEVYLYGINLKYGEYEIKAEHPDYLEVPKQPLSVDGTKNVIYLFDRDKDWKKKKSDLLIENLKGGGTVVIFEIGKTVSKKRINISSGQNSLTQKIEIGKYRLEIRHWKYEPIIKKDIVIKESEPFNLALKEKEWKLRSTNITVGHLPPGAKVKIDGKPYSYEEATSTGIKLEYKQHQIIASHKDYKPVAPKPFDVDGSQKGIQIYRKDEWIKEQGTLKIPNLKSSSIVEIADEKGVHVRTVSIPEDQANLNETLFVGTYSLIVSHWQYEQITIPGVIIKKDADTNIEVEDKWKFRIGKIKINLPPHEPQKTELWIDGNRLGYNQFSSRARDILLNFGIHQIRVSHPDFEPIREITLKVDTEYTKTIPNTNLWIRKKGILAIDVQGIPNKANIYIDDAPPILNLGNDREQPLNEGMHNLKVDHWQYYPWNKNDITIEWKGRVTIKPTGMRPRLGKLVFDEFKDEASAFIDGDDLTSRIHNKNIELIIGNHNVKIRHRQHFDMDYKVYLNEGEQKRVATNQDWKNSEKKGYVVIDEIKPNTKIYIDEKAIKNPIANKNYPIIIGRHKWKIENPLYYTQPLDHQRKEIVLKTHNSIDYIKTDYLLKKITFKVKDYEKVAFFDGKYKNPRIKDSELTLEMIENKKFYVLLFKTSGNSDPIEGYRCFLLPLGLPNTAPWMTGFTLEADSEKIILDGEKHLIGEKVFIFDETGRNVKTSIFSPGESIALPKGKYRLEIGSTPPYFFKIPYTSYIYLGKNVLRDIGEGLLLKDPFPAFHFYRIFLDDQGMQKSWFQYCEIKTKRVLKTNASKETLREVNSLWDRVQFEGTMHAQKLTYQTKIIKKISN